MPPGISLSHIFKRFGSLVALDDVSLSLRPGRVHGLLGENGAGKSTLMNVLYGLLRPDAGQIFLEGKPLTIRSPRDAIAAGIGMVHQHFMLAGAMTVLDNVLLGDNRTGRWLNRGAARRRLAALAEGIGLPVDPEARAGDLSVGGQQRVEILKALYRDAKVLVLDEPTAVLAPAETEQLMTAVARLRGQGKGVVFISHKLGEVKQICDDLTVLRRGKVVWEGRAAEVTAAELARHMIGRDVASVRLGRDVAPVGSGSADAPPADPLSPSPVNPGEGRGEGSAGGSSQLPPAPAASNPHAIPFPEYRERGLKTSRLAAPLRPDDRRRTPALSLAGITTTGLHDVSLSIAPGEMLGIAGVDGNGQQELAEIVVGLREADTGVVTIGGTDATALPLHQRHSLGVAHIPNDRNREGLVGSMSLAHNIALKRHDRRPFSLGGWMAWPKVRRSARELVARFDIRAGSVDVPVSTLSGGNAQKVILARELSLTEPKLVVAMNPVRGLDVAATNFVYDQLLARRAAGCAILLISSELDELLALCDRIGVLYGGRLTMSDFPTAGAAVEIGRLMAGVGEPRRVSSFEAAAPTAGVK